MTGISDAEFELGAALVEKRSNLFVSNFIIKPVKIYWQEGAVQSVPGKVKNDEVIRTCHSGSLIAMRSGDPEPALVQYYKMLAKSVSGTALIMSSKAEETSLESSGLRQGVFSHFLIRGLKGEADANHDKIVTIGEIYDYINANVRSYTGNRQSPVIKGTYDPRMPVSTVR